MARAPGQGVVRFGLGHHRWRSAPVQAHRRDWPPGVMEGVHATLASSISAGQGCGGRATGCAGVLQRGGLGFRSAARPAGGRGALRTAAALSARVVPLQREVAVQVHAPGVGVGADPVVGVFAPRQPGVGALAAVGVGVQQLADSVVVDGPGRVGVAAVVVDAPAGEFERQRRSGVFAGMDGGVDQQLGPCCATWWRDSAVGDLRRLQVVVASVLRLQPRTAGRHAAGQQRPCGDQCVAGREGVVFHGRVAGVTDDGSGMPAALGAAAICNCVSAWWRRVLHSAARSKPKPERRSASIARDSSCIARKPP